MNVKRVLRVVWVQQTRFDERLDMNKKILRYLLTTCVFLVGFCFGIVFQKSVIGFSVADGISQLHLIYKAQILSQTEEAYENEIPEISKWAVQQFITFLEREVATKESDKSFSSYILDLHRELTAQYTHLAVLAKVLNNDELYEYCILKIAENCKATADNCSKDVSTIKKNVEIFEENYKNSNSSCCALSHCVKGEAHSLGGE